jgi:tetratricopeptide (TPR) repeat protein
MESFMQVRTTMRIALVGMLLAIPAIAQEDPHANCASMGWVPREILERPLPLRANTGNSADKVTTKSPDALAYYQQGLNYLHGYVWIEAARSFNHAIRLDPTFAMAYWGLSRVYSGLDDQEAAVTAAKRAQELATTPREQRRAAIRVQQLEAIADLGNEALHAAYKQAIDKALIADFDDPELWLIRGNAEEPTAAGRGQRGFAPSVAFYLQALKAAPGNGAANHYLTHSYENLNRIDDALKHGEVYAGLATSVPHAHHMWGHDLRRVGRIDEAIAAFARTDGLEKLYYAQEKIPPGMDWHHVHNLDLLATSYEHKGQMRRAESLLREAAAIPPLTEYQSYNQKSLTVFLLGRQRWKDAIQSAKPLIASQSAATRVVGHTLTGHAWLAQQKLESANRSLQEASSALKEVPTLAAGIRVNQASVMPYIDALRAEIMLWEGKDDAGSALLMDVQRRLRALPGPDAWTQALFRLESFARTARAVGDWQLAEYTARQMLEHDGAYAGSHFAMATVAQHRGDPALAATEIAAAKKYWRDADGDLKELVELRRLQQQVAMSATRAAN